MGIIVSIPDPEIKAFVTVTKKQDKKKKGKYQNGMDRCNNKANSDKKRPGS